MFCPECGIEMPDNAKFCTKCGALTAREETPGVVTAPNAPGSESPAVPDATISGDPEKQGISEAAEPAPRRGSKPKIIAAIAAIILVICGIGGFAAYSHSQGQVYTLLAAPIADEYDAETASPTPVELVGTDARGNEIDKFFYVTPEHGIEAPQGEYIIYLHDPIVTGDGGVFTSDADQVKAKVDEGGWEIETPEGYKAAKSIDIPFKKIAPEDVTDEMIDQLRGWMKDAGLADDEIEKFIGAVTKVRQERLDQIAEEEAKRAAEEEAARKAEEERRATEEAANREITASEAEAIARDYFRQHYPDKWNQGWTDTGCKTILYDATTIEAYEVRFYDPASNRAVFDTVYVNPDGSVG